MAAPLPIEQKFAVSVLRRVKAPVTRRSVTNLIAWMRAEGGHTHNNAKFNFLNTTQPAPGAGNTGSQGNIKVYRSFDQGVNATAQTLQNGRYGSILHAFNANPTAFASAVNSTPWGTKTNFGSLAATISVPNNFGPSPLGRTAQSTGPAPVRAGDPGVDSSATPGSVAFKGIDGRKLMTLLEQAKRNVLAGKMPNASYATQLGALAKEAIIKQPIPASAKTAGAAVAAGAANAVGAPADKSSSQLINAAKEQLGVPYSWGGGGPKGKSRGFAQGASTVGFDCSSLVQYAYSKIGVKLPRVTYDQAKVGKQLNTRNRASWKPGDLIFPHAGHVQMYLGNGKVIEAPHTGGHVQIVPLRAGTPYKVTRPTG